MRTKIEAMQREVNEFMEYVKHELTRGIGDWEQRLSTALVKSSPTDLVRTTSDPGGQDDPESLIVHPLSQSQSRIPISHRASRAARIDPRFGIRDEGLSED